MNSTDTTIDSTVPTEKELDSLCHLLEIKHISADSVRRLYAAYDRLTAENAGLGESLNRRNIDYQKACLGKGELLDRINLQENEIERLRKLLLAATEEGA